MDSLFTAEKFPVRARREFASTGVESLRNSGRLRPETGRFGRNSLYFPCRSGNSAQRRVRERLHPPPLSLRLSRASAEGAIHSRECREIAGSWGLWVEGIQPETARFGRIGSNTVGSSRGAGSAVGSIHRISRKCVFKTSNLSIFAQSCRLRSRQWGHTSWSLLRIDERRPGRAIVSVRPCRVAVA